MVRSRMAVAVFSMATSSGCDLFMTLDELSAGDPRPDAGLEGGPDAGPSNVIFQDDFENGAALPRSWTTTFGAPELVSLDGAPAGSTVLRTFSPSAAPATSGVRLAGTAPPASTSITCSFSVFTRKTGKANLTYTGKLALPGFYVVLEIGENSALFYGQKSPGVSIYEPITISMANTWRRARMTFERSGRITVDLDGSRRVKEVPALGSVESFELDVGITTVPKDGDEVELAFDKVLCTADAE